MDSLCTNNTRAVGSRHSVPSLTHSCNNTESTKQPKLIIWYISYFKYVERMKSYEPCPSFSFSFPQSKGQTKNARLWSTGLETFWKALFSNPRCKRVTSFLLDSGDDKQHSAWHHEGRENGEMTPFSVNKASFVLLESNRPCLGFLPAKKLPP